MKPIDVESDQSKRNAIAKKLTSGRLCQKLITLIIAVLGIGTSLRCIGMECSLHEPIRSDGASVRG